MKILFLGTSDFSQIVLEKIIKSKHQVVGVVCQPDRPSGRGHKLVVPKIKEFAIENGIKVFQFEKVSQHTDEVFEGVDIAVTASFGQILSRDFINKKMCLNVHPSRLPIYRGPTPLQTALQNGDKKTAVSIQKMEYEVDSGDIILCQEVNIDDEDTMSTLTEKTANIGGNLAVKALDMIENGSVKFEKQDGSKATFTKMIKKEDGFLNFEENAEKIVNKVRALGENPGCYFFVGEDRIKVQKAKVFDEKTGNTGDILTKNKKFLVRANDRFVEILKCQAPNGKILDAKDFLNGYKFSREKANDTTRLE